MTHPTCHECLAPATHEDLTATRRPRYLCRHGAMLRHPSTVRRLTAVDLNMTPEEEAEAARLLREARKAARR